MKTVKSFFSAFVQISLLVIAADVHAGYAGSTSSTTTTKTVTTDFTDYTD